VVDGWNLAAVVTTVFSLLCALTVLIARAPNRIRALAPSEDSHRSAQSEKKSIMRGAVIYGAGDVRPEERGEPTIVEPTDAIVRNAGACVCGSDLWDTAAVNPVPEPTPFGHEYCGIVEAVGSGVTTVKPGQFVIGSFFSPDGTCPYGRNGFQTSCLHRELMSGCQAEAVRVPMADGSLVATPEQPSDDLIPSLLALSDVIGTGWFAPDCAKVQPGMTVAVVGGGAVGLCGVLAAVQMGAERVIAMSRHEPRQQLARQFGATDVVSEHGDEGVTRIKEMTNGDDAHGGAGGRERRGDRRGCGELLGCAAWPGCRGPGHRYSAGGHRV